MKENLFVIYRILGIIRVGSRCQNPRIECFSLQNARQQARETRSIPSHMYLRKWEILNGKTVAANFLKSQQDKMDESRTKIVSLSTFIECSVIDRRHAQSLVAPNTGDVFGIALTEWLDVFDALEQAPKDFIDNENQQTRGPAIEIYYDIEENVEDEFINEEEEQRRRDAFDIEEYDDSSSSNVRESDTTPNFMDRNKLLKDKNGSESESQQNEEN